MTPTSDVPQPQDAHARPLSVLIATRWYPAFDNPGRGIFVADQARALAAAGVQVTVASWETAYRRWTVEHVGATTPEPWLRAMAADASGPLPIPRSWGAAGIPVIRMPAVSPARSGVLPDPLEVAAHEAESLLAVGTALAARGRVDLIHAHTGLPDGVAAIALADRLGVPLVVTEHDRTSPERLKTERFGTAYRALCGDGRQLLVVSRALQTRLEAALAVGPLPIRVVPNVVEIEAFEPVGWAERDPNELLWVGGRKSNKGTDLLLESFRRLRERRPALRLRLVGSASDPAEEERLQVLARDLGIADAVAFDPPADRAGVASAMARAAVFVHPSPFETFGIVAAEALASGLPVATTPSGGVEEILGTDGRCGEIASGHDAASLVTAVEKVLDRRETFDPAVLRAHVSSRFAPAAVTAALLDTYRELLAQRPARVTASAVEPAELVAEAAAGERSPVLVVGMRRAAMLPRVAALPGDLARGLLVVTSVPPRAGADQPEASSVPGSADGSVTLHEVNPDRTYREARARLGGPLPPRSRPIRLLRAIRHPVRALRLRGLTRRREELAVATTRQAIREAIGAIANDGVPTRLLPLDADDLDVCLPLLGDRVVTYGSTLRGLADRWDAAGRPILAPPDTVATTVGRVGYDPARYWSQLHQRADLSAVGQSGLPPEINAWLYSAMARSFRAFLRRHGLDRPAPASAFDVGVGTGYWVRVLRSLGVGRVDGCDLVASAVEAVSGEARAAGVPGEFWVADLGAEDALPDRTYPMVTCFNVLIHVVDEERFDRALTGLAGLVAPGGSLLLAEPILLHDAYLRQYDQTRQASRARMLAQYRAPLEAAGLELVEVRAATVFANNPIEAGSPAAFRRYQAWWRFAVGQSKANPSSARWLGPLMSALDRVALRTGQAPTTKFALFRRPVAPPASDATP